MFHCDKRSVAVVKPSVEIEVTLFLVENSQSNKAAMPNHRLSEVLFPLSFQDFLSKLVYDLVSRAMKMEVGGQQHPGWLSETVS